MPGEQLSEGNLLDGGGAGLEECGEEKSFLGKKNFASLFQECN